MATESERYQLSSGRSMPIIGLGTYAPLQGEEEVIEAVKSAVRAGYRHIDCAAIYRNERAVGTALKELFVMGVVKREDIFITSKLWNTCHRPDLVLPNLEKTLDDLGVASVDLYLMHWPMAYKEGGDMCPQDENGKTLFSDVDYVETWQAMEDCRDMGKALDIGLSSFNSKQITRLLEVARVPPVAIQIEVNCHNTNLKLIEFAKSKGIVPIAFAPLSTPSIEPSHTKLLDEPVLKDIAKAHNKTPAQVAIRYLVQQGVASVPKSVTPSRIEENIKVFDFKLSEEEMTKLTSLNKGYRGYDEKIALDHKYYPFYEEF
ncbi:prostaglandin-E(2) 9-reductase [Aplysia californica]|uniref:Prostaglandin-E(2) 9-reductase n=1 Tax=Aplysia californica TaxID=6500 RepID=A0ABM0JNR7_APLCA|nr:prostaglandin-E(2) 9-reductase [Aplysia californica]